MIIALGGNPYRAVNAVAKASRNGIFSIFALTKHNTAMPATPTTIRMTIGPMMLPSIWGVQSFRPSKIYIIRANMMI